MKNQTLFYKALYLGFALLTASCGKGPSANLSDDAPTAQQKTVNVESGHYLVDVRGDEACAGNYNVSEVERSFGRELLIERLNEACDAATHLPGSSASIEIEFYEAGVLSFNDKLASGETVKVTVKKITAFEYLTNSDPVSSLPTTLQPGEYSLNIGTIAPGGGEFKLIAKRIVAQDQSVTIKLTATFKGIDPEECGPLCELGAAGDSVFINEKSTIKLDVSEIPASLFSGLAKLTTQQIYPTK
ncbi:MAG: hypothetical protein AB7T49_18035 [Oligoflexales bacterium]